MAWIAYWLVISTTFLAAPLAIWKGDKALRLGGMLRIFMILVGMPVQHLLYRYSGAYGLSLSYYDLGSSFLTAVCFLILAFRYSNLWLGMAMVIQGGELYVSSLYLDGAAGGAWVYETWENLTTTGVSACLFFGTLAALRRRQTAAAARKTPMPEAVRPA